MSDSGRSDDDQPHREEQCQTATDGWLFPAFLRRAVWPEEPAKVVRKP
jgi:hypothetical protein